MGPKIYQDQEVKFIGFEYRLAKYIGILCVARKMYCV